ncbi:diaminopimelate epimerase [Halioxenophilus sp. WMMB6]|uniref:diaminopimelate epimerase n=1 Tax=Halioxenophilus sp. WMMB6 TaxID=3073815 RepID=UPI00295E4CA6|nr:diaminopimelate epimerase [Halioxenophilus sp. WMMB6]
MRIRFTKMQGLGNDFIVIDGISQQPNLTPHLVQRLSDRRFGIGCDQLLVVEHPTKPEVDFRYRIFNADGSEVENCGNGARCFAKFVRDRRLTGKSVITVETASGIMTLKVLADGQVSVDMGAPILLPNLIPLQATNQNPTYRLEIDDKTIEFGSVSMGNPHAVLQVNDINAAPVATLGAKIESHPMFPKRVNVGFMERVSASEINLRVFERGVGETLACGTGACAAVVSGRLQGLLDEQVNVHLPGGDLVIRWSGCGQSVIMTGPAVTVFHGQIRV